MEAPKVFISYSHDTPEHAGLVLALSDRLRQDGIDSHIDQYEVSPQEGWPRWMANKVEWADFVLVVCTDMYQQRFKGKAPAGQGKGVKWEGAILTQELYDAEAQNTRFIPVVFSAQDTGYIPVILRGRTYYDVSTDKGYDALYRHLTGQPAITMPSLGKLKPMPQLNPVQDSETIINENSQPKQPVHPFVSSQLFPQVEYKQATESVHLNVEIQTIEEDYMIGMSILEAGTSSLEALTLGGYIVFEQFLDSRVSRLNVWSTLAEKENARAQCLLGCMYWYKSHREKNFEEGGRLAREAERWVRLAAEQGDAGAQTMLGLIYEKGGYLARDYKGAIWWYRLAAEQGNARACYLIGVMYRYGHGVKRDYKEAERWYRLAAEHGYQRAKEELEPLRKEGRSWLVWLLQ